MKKIACICFTENGFSLLHRVEKILLGINEEEIACDLYCKGKLFENRDLDHVSFVKESTAEWAGKHFSYHDALIFIGATGIAVRAIAPYVKDKRLDPAVIVFDEKGTFCIPLLSGHIGGANELCLYLSGQLGCTPVVTTATDVNQKFAVDVFATKQNLMISNMTYAKEVSASLLSGEQIGVYSDFPIDGELPDGLIEVKQKSAPSRPDDGSLGIQISPFYKEAMFDHSLWLIPKCLTLGIGCRKFTNVKKIEELVKTVLQDACVYPESIVQVTSIDLKKDEPGLLEFCEKYNLPFITYSADELREVKGDFSASDFVSSVTGVDNVCERSAILGSKGRLLIKKVKGDGVTVAVAISDRRVTF